MTMEVGKLKQSNNNGYHDTGSKQTKTKTKAEGTLRIIGV